jgi:signal transduction histidine kinase
MLKRVWLFLTLLISADALRRFRSPRQTETILGALGEGIIVLDSRGCVTYVNPSATTLASLGQPFQSILEKAGADYTQLIHGTARQMRLVIRGKTYAATSSKHASDTILVLRDITDEETGRNLHSYFLAHMSHEFRTPLSGLNASLELLLDDLSSLSRAEIDELLNSIYLSASGLQALVDNLLESATIEAGHFVIHRRPVEFNQVLGRAIQMMQPLLDRRKQTLSLTEPLQPPTLHADPTRLTQVLINLLSNASKYSPLEERIDLNLSQIGQQLHVSIADRGPGIPPAERAALFRQFVRLNAPDTEQYGIGLGLSVVKTIIEGHGGDVGVDERPGGGSIFWFSLPLTGRPT